MDVDKKRLEHDEDRLLTTMLYNLIGYMVAIQVPMMCMIGLFTVCSVDAYFFLLGAEN